jgi:hypothetical protein
LKEPIKERKKAGKRKGAKDRKKEERRDKS